MHTLPRCLSMRLECVIFSCRTTWLNYYKTWGMPVLVGFNAALTATQLEGLTDQQVIKQAMQVGSPAVSGSCAAALGTISIRVQATGQCTNIHISLAADQAIAPDSCCGPSNCSRGAVISFGQLVCTAQMMLFNTRTAGALHHTVTSYQRFAHAFVVAAKQIAQQLASTSL